MLIKKTKAFVIIVILICASVFSIVLLTVFYNSQKFQNVDANLLFTKNYAYQHVENQLSLGYRIPGTQERKNCANYFRSEFRKIDSNFYYKNHDFTVGTTSCQNVLFKLNKNKENIVILAAHYDSRAIAEKDSSISDRTKPVPGANDGASGSAVLVELASVLYKRRFDLSCQVWFLFFDAEDQGSGALTNFDWCEGSNKFVEDINQFYDISKENIECLVLLDMVGGENLQFINEQYSTSSLLGEIFEIGRRLGYYNEFPVFPISSSVIDDHTAFINSNIPSADLIINFWDNPSWPYHHTTEDDLSHISRNSLDVTGKTIEQFIYNNYLNVPNNDYQGNHPWK